MGVGTVATRPTPSMPFYYISYAFDVGLHTVAEEDIRPLTLKEHIREANRCSK